ncbi:MAG: DUF2202 domain-containing protein [Bacteroidetes bacterium]|nr:DUF2202 domain-containing protein [Bacteroidota bacterium]
MKTLTFNKSVMTIMSVFLMALIMMSCSKDDDIDTPMTLPDSDGYSKTLSPAEKEGLLYLAEKEKMMRNVYESISTMYENTVFADLSVAKAQHMNLLSVKIDKYDLENPIGTLSHDEFQNPLIQNEFDEFTSFANLTLVDAIVYSKALEESTIDDLEVLLENVKGNGDLVHTYRQILESSQLNLDALSLETKGLIDIAVWYDPVKVFKPKIKGVRDIIKLFDPIKED